MSKIIYFLFIILYGCGAKTTIIDNNKNNKLINKIEQKEDQKEILKYDKGNNIYTLKLENTSPFTFSLNNNNDNSKLYQQVKKENISVIEVSKSPLIKTVGNKINIESYILDEVGNKKDKVLDLKSAINEVLKQKDKINLGNSNIKIAFEKSFGNYFFDIENGDLTNLKQDENKLKLLRFLQKQLSNFDGNSTNDDIDKFLQSLHIEKINTNKDNLFINGKILNNFTYFDFGIWEQNLSTKYNGDKDLKEYFNFKDENKHNFIPFISASDSDKVVIKPNTPMIFNGLAFAGVKNGDKYKIFNGNVKFEINENNEGNMFFDFTNWEKFSFNNISFNKDSFEGKNFSSKLKENNDFTIPESNLKTIQLNGNFYGKDEVVESSGVFKIENGDKSYRVDGVFGLKRN